MTNKIAARFRFPLFPPFLEHITVCFLRLAGFFFFFPLSFFLVALAILEVVLFAEATPTYSRKALLYDFPSQGQPFPLLRFRLLVFIDIYRERDVARPMEVFLLFLSPVSFLVRGFLSKFPCGRKSSMAAGADPPPPTSSTGYAGDYSLMEYTRPTPGDSPPPGPFPVCGNAKLLNTLSLSRHFSCKPKFFPLRISHADHSVFFLFACRGKLQDVSSLFPPFLLPVELLSLKGWVLWLAAVFCPL